MNHSTTFTAELEQIEDPYEVSDEEMEREEAEEAITELFALNDDAITIPQAARFLKALAKLRRQL